MRAVAAVKSFTGEIELTDLLKKLLLAMLEISSAQRGCLLLNAPEDVSLEAVAEKPGQPSQRVKISAGNQEPSLCRTMVDLAIRQETTVVTKDASADGRFRSDAYIQKYRPKSILCMPIHHRQEMLGLVYLENHARPDAFDLQAKEMLNLLALQAGVSIKNAALCRELDNSLSELRKEIAKHSDTRPPQLRRAGRLSALGRMSASLAHEFGNPLMGVTYLLDDLSGRSALTERDRQLISVGLDDCRRMKKLLEELHCLHNLSRKNRIRFSLNEALSETLLLLQKVFADSKIEVHTELADDLPDLCAARDQILRVVGALIEFRAQAMADGGSLRLQTEKCGDFIALHIRACSGAVAPDHQEHIFEPVFFDEAVSSGPGLELAVAYAIVENHGGEITFRSTGGTASTLSLSLPVLHPDGASDGAPSDRGQAGHRGVQ